MKGNTQTANRSSANLEFERTFLATPEVRTLLEGVQPTIMRDVYVPLEAQHPKLRLRKSGSHYEITKKIRSDSTASVQEELTIPLTSAEFETLSASSARKIEKRRYVVEIDGHRCEIDVFDGNLEGLVLLDFEFASESAMCNFIPLRVCLSDVSEDDFIAGGVLSGSSYQDIADRLSEFGYVAP